MSRRALAVVLFFAAVAPGFAQQRDRVFFRDRQADFKPDSTDGEVTESPAGVTVKLGANERIIPAYDLIRVDYSELDPFPGRLGAVQAEGTGDATPADALKYYADKAKAVPANAPEKAKRYVAFREAYWHGRVAAGKPEGEFADEAKKAVEKMQAFVTAYPKTWEQWQIGRTAARLSAEIGDWKAADAILAKLARVPDAPTELTLDAALARVGYLLRAGDYPAAKAALAGVESAPQLAGGLKDRAAVYAAALDVLPAKDAADIDPLDPAVKKKVNPTAAVGKIEKLIAASKDPVARAVGYGVLGEVQLAHRQFRPATWSFLWVDTVYNQDKDERVFALHRLAELFELTGDRTGDTDRADTFRERLQKAR